MEEREQEEKKPWDGQDRRRGANGEYKGDERRKAMEQMPGGNPRGGNPGQG